MTLLCDASKFSEIALRSIPECTCGNCAATNHWEFYGEDDSHYFECKGCKRSVPWCFGTTDHSPNGDDLTAYCDDCAVEIATFQSEAPTPTP